jgi:hypothetical protein
MTSRRGSRKLRSNGDEGCRNGTRDPGRSTVDVPDAVGQRQQPVGHRPENRDVMYKSGKDVWAPELLGRRPDLNTMVDKYLHDLYSVRPDFVYSVSRDFARSCQTPMLVMPDDTPAHPYQTSVDIASLAPNAEVTVYPWRDPRS